MRCPDEWACGGANDGGSCCDIAGYDGTGANDGAGADPNPREHDCTRADKCEIAHDDLSGKSRARCDVDAIADDAIMIDGSSRVDDDRLAKPSARAHGALGKNLASVAYLRIRGQKGGRMFYGKWRVAARLEP